MRPRVSASFSNLGSVRASQRTGETVPTRGGDRLPIVPNTIGHRLGLGRRRHTHEDPQSDRYRDSGDHVDDKKNSVRAFRARKPA